MKNSEALDILGDLLPAKKPAKGTIKKINGKPAVKGPLALSERPISQQVAIERTGLITWKATAKVVILQRQECQCCGSLITCVDQEFFQLENGQLHNVWRRTEGYDIESPEDLPLITEYTEQVRKVSACVECVGIDIELTSRQLTMGF